MIYYYIPDFFWHYHVNLKLLELMRDEPQMFYDDFKIGAVFGNFPNCIWNGGRAFFGRHVDVTEMKEISKAFNDFDVPLRLTMTNLMVKDTDIYDRYSNYIMQNLNNGFNQVIVSSPILEKYIREKYPEYPVVRSVQAAEEIFYDDSDKYIMSIIKRRKNNDFEFLKSIKNKDKIEFVSNESCFEDCNMSIHYRHTSMRQLYEKEKEYICPHYKPIGKDQTIFCTSASTISRELIKKIYEPMGFSNFKISGRHLNSGALVGNYVHYMVRPEWKDDFYTKMYPAALADGR